MNLGFMTPGLDVINLDSYHIVWETQKIEIFWMILNNTVFMIGIKEKLYLNNFLQK